VLQSKSAEQKDRTQITRKRSVALEIHTRGQKE
jgi:hypothetical protein